MAGKGDKPSFVDRAILFWIRQSRSIQNSILAFFRIALFQKVGAPNKVLVFRTGSIGDNVCAMPALMAIRKAFPNAQLDILTNAGARNLVSLQAIYDPNQYHRMIDYLGHSPRRLLELLRKEKYDLVVELPQDQVRFLQELRNILFFKLANIRSGFGWQVNTVFVGRQLQERYNTFHSERDRLLDLLQEFIPNKPQVSFPINITDSDREAVVALWNRLDSVRKKVGLVPGAKRPQNRYPIERMSELAVWLVQKGYEVVIVGGPEDKALAEKIQGNFIHSFCGKLTPVQSAFLLSKCAATISNDTGPMHLSYAVGTPVIGLFSSRDFPNKWFPPTHPSGSTVGNIALRNDNVHCSLCFSETCANNICMQGIPLEAVKNAFLQIEEAIG